MARNSIELDVGPERVWEVLGDGRAYADWVVGAQNIRDVDPAWPAPGARLHHTVGVGPLRVKDHTEVRAVERLRRLVLRARVRPAGEAEIELTVEPTSAGSRVVMAERVVRGPGRGPLAPLIDGVIQVRNAEALRRLAGLVSPGRA